MNIVSIIAIIIILLQVLTGMRRGLIKTIFSTFAFAVAIIVAIQFGPMVSRLFQDTSLYTNINERIEQSIFPAEDIQEIDEDQENSDQEDVTRVTDQVELINNLPLPQALKDALIENNNAEIYEALGINRFKAYVANYLTQVVINAISFLLTFAVVFLLLKIIQYSLDLLSKIPVLNGINRIGGMAFGLINGVAFLWIICIVATVFSTTSWGQYLFQQINDSTFLQMIYNNNYLLVGISSMKNLLF